MEELEADMDIEQIEMKIARMKREISRKQQKLRIWEKAARMMKNASKREDEEKPSAAADAESGMEATEVQEQVSGQTYSSSCDAVDPPTQVEDPPCRPPEDVLALSNDKLEKPPLTDQEQDSAPKEEALRRSSRRSRSSYILNSDEFVTLDFRHAKSKRKPGSQASPEPESCPAAPRSVFPEPPPIVAKQPVVNFFLPDDEFAAWKIRFRRKTSLRSGTKQAPKHKGPPRSEDDAAAEGSAAVLERPLLSRFEALFSLDTQAPESVELVHCGRVALGTGSTRAIAAVQSSKVSVWTEEDDAWTLLLTVPLVLQQDGFYRFSGFNSTNSMGLALIAEAGGIRAVWCYDFSPPGKERCLESVAARKQGQSSKASLICVTGETLVCAQVGSRGTQLKAYHLKVLGGKQACRLSSVKDELNSLRPIAGLKDAVIGFSATTLYVWNHATGELCKKMETPGNVPFQKCTFAQEEAGLLVLGVVTGDSNPRHHLIVVNPAQHKWRVLLEYQDVAELPNQCLQGTIRVGQHLVTGGGIDFGRVAIWNIFSGNLAAFLNDGAVTAVGSFPAACTHDFMIATGSRCGNVVLYKLPFPQVQPGTLPAL